ncbi:MAG: helix-turn-helix domain-containing protein [Arenibacter latericius]|nr:helix-turn-helix domain-containing protein [Arenibacter latericius]
MVKDFAKKLDYDIPAELRNSVLGVIVGKSYKPVTLTGQPMYATGFPLLVFSQGVIPQFQINENELIPESPLNIAGQIYNASVTFSSDGIMDNLGLVLYPTAIYYLFHKPGSYYLNRWKDLVSESPIEGRLLYKKLIKNSDQEHRILLLLDYLKGLNKNRLEPIDWLDRAIASILQSNGIIQQSILAEQAGVSMRHFRRVFKNIIGMPPKYYCKVIQINTVFHLMNSSASDKLHHLALDCGYYDQAHFIKDFNKFIGASPENFLNGHHAYVKSYLGRSSKSP